MCTNMTDTNVNTGNVGLVGRLLRLLTGGKCAPIPVPCPPPPVGTEVDPDEVLLAICWSRYLSAKKHPFATNFENEYDCSYDPALAEKIAMRKTWSPHLAKNEIILLELCVTIRPDGSHGLPIFPDFIYLPMRTDIGKWVTGEVARRSARGEELRSATRFEIVFFRLDGVGEWSDSVSCAMRYLPKSPIVVPHTQQVRQGQRPKRTEQRKPEARSQKEGDAKKMKGKKGQPPIR